MELMEFSGLCSLLWNLKMRILKLNRTGKIIRGPKADRMRRKPKR